MWTFEGSNQFVPLPLSSRDATLHNAFSAQIGIGPPAVYSLRASAAINNEHTTDVDVMIMPLPSMHLMSYNGCVTITTSNVLS